MIGPAVTRADRNREIKIFRITPVPDKLAIYGWALIKFDLGHALRRLFRLEIFLSFKVE